MWFFGRKKIVFDVPVAYRLINLSRLAYLEEETIKKELEGVGTEFISFIENKKTDTQCYIARDNEDLFIVFRGTESIKDAFIDVSIIMKRYPQHGRSLLFFKPKVHSGFLKAYLSVKEEIFNKVQELIIERNVRQIYVTGHSLGGALAVLTALDLVEELKPKSVYMMNFGGPKVGNRWYVRRYNKKVKQSFRVVNDEDVVPNLPPGSYKHVKHLVFINNHGEVKIDPKISEQFLESIDNALALLTGKAIKDHFSRYYASVIKGLLNKTYDL